MNVVRAASPFTTYVPGASNAAGEFGPASRASPNQALVNIFCSSGTSVFVTDSAVQNLAAGPTTVLPAVITWNGSQTFVSIVRDWSARFVTTTVTVTVWPTRNTEGATIDNATGAVALGHPPSALWALAGARVWLGGPLDTGPTVYGVIVPVR